MLGLVVGSVKGLSLEPLMALHMPSSSEGRERVYVPSGRQAGCWLASLKALFRKLDVGPQARHAFEAWAALEARRGRSLDWTPHQVAAGLCDATTIRRALPRLLAAGICHVVTPADHGLRKAGVYRFSRMVPTQLPASQNAKRPSPGTCSTLKIQSTPSVRSIHTTHTAPELSLGESGLHEHGEASQWSKESQMAILEILQTLGSVGSSGWHQVLKTSPLDETRALQVVRAAVSIAPLKARSNPVGWSLKALRTVSFAEDILRMSADLASGNPSCPPLLTPASAWGEQAPRVHAALQQIPVDPAGAIVAERTSWCAGHIALQVIEACQLVWRQEGLPPNPGGFACKALRVRGMGESLLAQASTTKEASTRLGRALMAFREEERVRRQDPNHSVDRRHPFWHIAELAEAIREICKPESLEASERVWTESWGIMNLSQGPRSLSWRAWIAAGLTTGLISGWDLEAWLNDGTKAA